MSVDMYTSILRRFDDAMVCELDFLTCFLGGSETISNFIATGKEPR